MKPERSLALAVISLLATVLAIVACGEDALEDKTYTDYAGGPLLACPAAADACFKGLPEGNECQEGELLVTQCLVGDCGDCCKSVFNLPRPCCHGYWLFYSREWGQCHGGNDLGICPEYQEVMTGPNCINYHMTCDCNAGSKEPGWHVVEHALPANIVCKEFPDQIAAKALYLREVTNWGKCNFESRLYPCPVSCDASQLSWLGCDNAPPTAEEGSAGIKRQVQQCLAEAYGLECGESEATFFCTKI